MNKHGWYHKYLEKVAINSYDLGGVGSAMLLTNIEQKREFEETDMMGGVLSFERALYIYRCQTLVWHQIIIV